MIVFPHFNCVVLTDRVETRITAHLRDQLGTAKNANEMFRIFSRFNALFVRPHIRGAIREYQTQLIQRVKDDIEALHEKFKVLYFSIETIGVGRYLRLSFSDSILSRQKLSLVRRKRFTAGRWFYHLGSSDRQSINYVFEAR